MDRSLAHASSLAQRFFLDFASAQSMPLLVPDQELRAFEEHVKPLLQLGASCSSSSAADASGSSSATLSLAPLLDAVRRLTAVFSAQPDGLATYEAARSAAEYVQSRFALALLEAAAAASDLLPGSSASTLAAVDADAAAELLAEDLRRRLLANGLPQWGASVAAALDAHPAVAAATPCPADMDRLLLPASAGYAFDQPGGNSGSNSSNSAAALVYRPFQLSVAAARRSASSSSWRANGAATILKRAAWRRQLARGCSHYVAPLLGSEGRGSSAAVVLTGSSLAAAIKGVGSTSSTGTSSTSSSTSSISSLAFVGYASPAAAQQSLDGCLAEVLTRYFKRHPVPLTSAAEQPLLPLAVATAHHLMLLLPEPTQALLPAAVQVDGAAVAAAAEAGAAVPAAVAAAAAAPSGPTAAAAAGFRDVVLSFDLALHSSTEVLLLGAPHPLAALAWDGDGAYCLASSVRALAAGGVLVDAAAAARGPGWCSDPQPAGEGGSGQQAAPAPAPAPAGSTSSARRARGGELTAAGVQAACREVGAVAQAGWQPLLLLPLPTGAGGGSVQQQRVLLAAFASAGMALQLPLAPARLLHLQQQQQQYCQALEAGGLLQQLLVADAGLLLQHIGSSDTLRALLDCWPAACSSSSSEEQLWQQAAAAGSSLWRHLEKLLPAVRRQQHQRQHQHSSVADALDLAVPEASVVSAAAAAASITQQQPGSQHTHASAGGGELSPLVVMTQPQLLRALLDQSQQQQQQQAAAPAARVLPPHQRQRLLQQLRQAGWVWGCVQPPQPSTGGAALPAHVACVLPGRWWPGPVMRGSALLGSVLPQE